MIIKELNLIGFGQFKNKIIKLEDGINLLQGENEVGKSTIHSFIDGMFYGFLRPNLKSTIYTKEHKKYEPWNCDRYAGIIKFEYQGEDYRIERIFTKNMEETKVFIESTGEDITNIIDNGSNTRVLQPGIHFFGLSSIEYRNTVSIKQLGSKTDDKLANEVRDKLVNLTTSLDEGISIENAVNQLDKQVKDIGTERAKTSPYGKIQNKLDNIIDEKREINTYKSEYEKLLDDDKQLEENIEKVENQLLEQKNQLGLAIHREKQEKYDDALKMQGELDELKNRLKSLDRYKNLIESDYKIAVEKSNEISIIYSKIEDVKVQIAEIENTNTSNKLQSSDLSIKKDQNKYKAIIATLAFLYIVLMILSVVKDRLELSILFQLLLVPITLLSFRLFQNIQRINYVNGENERIIEENKSKIIALTKRVDGLWSGKEELSGDLNRIFRINDVSSIDEFELNLQNKKAYDSVLSEYTSKMELLKRILGKYTIEELETILSEEIDIEDYAVEDKESIQEDIDNQNKELTELKINKRGMEERINFLIPKISRLVGIEEDIQRYQNEIIQLDKQKKSLELAKLTIVDLSKNIQDQFAPKINVKVGNLLKKITNGKYSDVRISDKLNIDVLSPESDEIININSLSAGTIDQLYFSLRFGIINSITKNNVPLILDDCFTQYDDNRLGNILELIGDISDERQIILFSCHKREKSILNNRDINFNMITLDEVNQ